MDALVEVEYWDDDSGSFGIQYDAFGNAYQHCPERALLGGLHQWKQAKFHLSNARFANSQNGRSDFRIAVQGEGLHVRRLSWKRLPPAVPANDPWAKLAAAYRLTGDELALETLLTDHPEAVVGVADFHLANQMWQQALEIYEQLVAEKASTNLLNKQALASNNRAWELVSTWRPDGGDRELEEGLGLAIKACELDPKNLGYRKTLGVAYYRNSQWENAREALERSIERGVDDPCNWLFLAMAYQQLSDQTQARMWYDKAIAWRQRKNPDAGLEPFFNECEQVFSDSLK
jgi:tetratricopeptide (TPR) repeat protein